METYRANSKKWYSRYPLLTNHLSRTAKHCPLSFAILLRVFYALNAFAIKKLRGWFLGNELKINNEAQYVDEKMYD